MKRRKPAYYSIHTANVRYDKNLKANEKLLFSEITALINRDGYCSATNIHFANLYDVSKGTVSKWISHLKSMGYLKVKMIYQNNEIIQRRLYPLKEEELLVYKQINDTK